MNKLLFILLFAFSAIGIYGCSQKENFSNDEKKQFTEIITASGEMIGIIDNHKEIERFVNQLDIESWNDMEQLPEDRDLAYSYTCELKVCTTKKPENPSVFLTLPVAHELSVLCMI